MDRNVPVLVELRKKVHFAGGYKKVADHLGLSPSTIYNKLSGYSNKTDADVIMRAVEELEKEAAAVTP